MRKTTDMNYIYKTAAIIATAMLSLVACKNAGAQTVTELTVEDFTKKVYDLQVEELVFLGEKPAIVDFTASWCGPCRQMAPILEEIAKKYAGKIDVYKVDVDKCRELAQAFGISSIPAVLYIPLDGEPSMTIGARSRSRFEDEIAKLLQVTL